MANHFSYVNRKLLNFLIGEKNYNEISDKIKILDDPDRHFFKRPTKFASEDPRKFVPKNRQECYQCLAWSFGQIMKANLDQPVEKQFIVGISGGFIREYILRDQAPNDIDFKIGFPRKVMSNKVQREEIIRNVKYYLPNTLKKHWPIACQTTIPGSNRNFFDIHEQSMGSGIGLSILFFVHPEEGGETHGRPAEDMSNDMKQDGALLFHCDGNSIDAFDAYNELPFVPSSSDNFKLVIDKKTRQYELKLSINVNLPPWPSLALAIALNLRQQTVFYYDVQEWVNDRSKTCRSKAPKLYKMLDDNLCINNPASKCNYISILRGWNDKREQTGCRSRVIERLNRSLDRNFYVITGYNTDNKAQNVASGRGDKSLISSAFYNQGKAWEIIIREWEAAKKDFSKNSRDWLAARQDYKKNPRAVPKWNATLFKLKNTTEIPWSKLASRSRLDKKIYADQALNHMCAEALKWGINPYYWFLNYFCNLIKLDGPSIPGSHASPQQQEDYCKELNSLLYEEAQRLILDKTQYNFVKEGSGFDVPDEHIVDTVKIGNYVKYISGDLNGTIAKITKKTPDGKRWYTDGGPTIKPWEQDQEWEITDSPPKKKTVKRKVPKVGSRIKYIFGDSNGTVATITKKTTDGKRWFTDGGPTIKAWEQGKKWIIVDSAPKKTFKSKVPKVGSRIKYIFGDSNGTVATITKKTSDGKRWHTDGGPLIKPWEQGKKWILVNYGGGSKKNTSRKSSKKTLLDNEELSKNTKSRKNTVNGRQLSKKYKSTTQTNIFNIDLPESINEDGIDIHEDGDEGKTFKIISHNVGGQTMKTHTGKRFLSDSRGYFNHNGAEILNTYFINPKSIREEADVTCFQEYPGLFSQSGSRQTDLYILDKNTQYEETGDLRERILEYKSQYKVNGKQIVIVNFHGKIISDTSSYRQISSSIDLMLDLIELYDKYENLIIIGDFNFELMNNEYIEDTYQNMINTRKRGTVGDEIRSNAERIKEELTKYIAFFRFNFNLIIPDEPTNTWSLVYDDSNLDKEYEKNYQTTVDQCMISKKFNGIKSIEYEVLDGYMADQVKPVELLQNDFDHAPLLVEIKLDEPYEI